MSSVCERLLSAGNVEDVNPVTPNNAHGFSIREEMWPRIIHKDLYSKVMRACPTAVNQESTCGNSVNLQFQHRRVGFKIACGHVAAIGGKCSDAAVHWFWQLGN